MIQAKVTMEEALRVIPLGPLNDSLRWLMHEGAVSEGCDVKFLHRIG